MWLNISTMNNNNELKQKLEREIWLFEQWLVSIEGEQGETQNRIREAYEECIEHRKQMLDDLTRQVSYAG